jgi:hypothetical protein
MNGDTLKHEKTSVQQNCSNIYSPAASSEHTQTEPRNHHCDDAFSTAYVM